MIGRFDTGARQELVRRLLQMPDGTALVRLLADHDEAVRWGMAKASREEVILVSCSCDDPGCTEQVELGFSSDSDDLLARLDAAAPAPESPREERDRLYREHVQACTDPRHKHPALDTPNDPLPKWSSG